MARAATPARAPAPTPAPAAAAPKVEETARASEAPGAAAFDFGAIAIGPPPPLRLQPKLVVGGVEDPSEHEADQVAELFTRRRGLAGAGAASPAPPPPPASAASPPSLVQRKCGACKSEDEVARASGAGPDFAAGALPVDLADGIHEASRAGGRPLPAASRRELEPFFGVDFGQVRVHADERAARLAGSVDAAAFTVGNDVFFGRGRFDPGSGAGVALLAHELNHVVQQRGAVAPGVVQRQVGRGTPGRRAPLVENDVDPGPGAMRIRDFIAAMRRELTTLCNGELAAVGRSADGCPYLQRWLEFYAHQPVRSILRAIQMYAHPPADADAHGLLEAVKSRVRAAVRTWIATGHVGVPEGAGALPPDSSGQAVQGKAAEGGGGGAVDPVAVQASLGAGRPLEAGVRGRMERAFGASFASVRVHDDAPAARTSRDLAVRAFAVGDDVGFAGGEYRPGTLVGDLLIAHELAHTLQQQRGVAGAQTAGAANDAWERQADRAAVAALLGQPAELPASGVGLQFQGCQVGAGVALVATLETAEVGVGVGVAAETTAIVAPVAVESTAVLAPAAVETVGVLAPAAVEAAPVAAPLLTTAAPTALGATQSTLGTVATVGTIGALSQLPGDTAPTPAVPGSGIEAMQDPEFASEPEPQSTGGEDTDDDKGTECANGPRCPHLGGSLRHNHCADTVTGNLHPGCDFWVAGKNFDALGPGRVLWEIKTWNYSQYSERGRKFAMDRLIFEAAIERIIALRCGYEYVIGVTDPLLARHGAERDLPITMVNCPTIH